jgi:hypothetical protein
MMHVSPHMTEDVLVLAAAMAAMLALVGVPICLGIFRRVLRASFGTSIASAVVLFFAGSYLSYQFGQSLHIGSPRQVFGGYGMGTQTVQRDVATIFLVWAVAFLPMLGVPFVIFLARKWFGDLASENERAVGSVGFAAWFRPMYVIWAAVVALGWAAWINMPFVSALALAALLLAAMPLAKLTTGGAAPVPQPEPDHNQEREQILRMVEERKINAEEGVELLNALSATYARPSRPAISLAPARRIVLAGAALVAIGFIMPWFSINLTGEMRRLQETVMPGTPAAMESMTQMQKSLLQMQESFGSSLFTAALGGNGKDISIRGSDVGHGLGWFVLLLVAGATAAPYLLSASDRQNLRLATLLPLLAAGGILLYLAAPNLRYVSYGLLVVLVGYGFALAGNLREWRSQSPTI